MSARTVRTVSILHLQINGVFPANVVGVEISRRSEWMYCHVCIFAVGRPNNFISLTSH